MERTTSGVERTASVEAPCPPEALFAWVDDLSRYPAWLEIVDRAEPLAGPPGPPDEEGPVWTVELRGRLGPLARTKRLRMVRVAHDPPRTVRFERRERDGRQHSPWVLEASVEPTPGGSRLTMRLHYGGRLFAPVVERLLGDEIERSRQRLLACLSPD